ncbi:MAG: oxidoreductase [Gammaproteobacteria bacterium CG11_big_fil_rev_8_21_14_0_20_46_22]|nr:MAG: oxidoreductase [Gammaproteobacteria bacterium CG12_big_fil_rev_8_21_14_0_65_46_12]PIR11384.1 MAG: oxidoreductase [Gammaproteobacteria bacterium CG11_big_fil_rev_8_21_14_0_20_46_22]
MMKQEKSLVVITGASSGIGLGLAKAFSNAGYPLALLARNVAAMEALNLPNTRCIKTDVTDIDAFKKAIALAEEEFGPVDCLINNAGFAEGGEFSEQSHDAHEKTVQVNLQGVINGCEAVLPGMRKRGRGTIINMSSVADRSSRPQLATYAATKAAVKSLTESLRMANASYKIRVCNVAPAKIRTPMLMTANLKGDQIIEIEDVVNAVLWLYEQPQSVCIPDIVIAPTTYEP